MIKEGTQILIEKAESCLASARILQSAEEFYPDTIAFLLQQAIEKILKAFLAQHGEGYPKIHDLYVLLEHCKELDSDFARISPEDFDLLNYFAVAGRYSDDMMAGMEEIVRFQETAQQCKDLVELKIQ